MTTLLSAYYIALTILAITALNLYVTYQRTRSNVWVGDGDDVSLARARGALRAMLNYTPVFLLALLTFELTGGAKSWIHPLGVVFLFGRWLHVMSALFFGPKNLARTAGSLVSLAATAAACIGVLLRLW